MRRTSGLIAIALVALLGLGLVGTADAKKPKRTKKPAAARAVATPQSIAQAAAASGLFTLSNVSITSTSSPITATATLTAASGAPMQVSVSYVDASNYTIAIARNSAGSWRPATTTSLNVNNIVGTITVAGGRPSFNLTADGTTVGDGTFTLNVTIDRSGFVGEATVNDMTIGGMVLRSADVVLNTVNPYASIVATLETEAGTFDATIQATGLSGGGYTLYLSVSGADLKGGGPDFQMPYFSFATTVTAPATGCTNVLTSITGKVEVGNNTYTLNNGTLEFCGQDIKQFIFSFTYSHYSELMRQTKSLGMTINWQDPDGVAQYTDVTGNTYSYTSGFFGRVDLSNQKEFSKKYGTRRFKRGVTLGLAFGVGVFTRADNGKTEALVGGGGYVDADRVGGSIACVFQVAPGTDMDCTARFHVNPSWAGKYGITWNGV